LTGMAWAVRLAMHVIEALGSDRFQLPGFG
jgi:hypothetical protein